MMHLVSDINLKYFYYNNQYYTTGTIVKLTKAYTNLHLFDKKPIWAYACFSHRVINNGNLGYFFFSHKINSNVSNKYCCYFIIAADELENSIEEVVEPIKIELTPKTRKKDIESEGVMIGWIIYIVALLFSFIFTQWYLIWVWGSVLFFTWRRKKLWE